MLARMGDEESQPTRPTAGAWIAVLAVLTLVGVACYRIYPGTLPREDNPSFLTVLFDNGIVLFFARLAALALAFFVVASVIQRTRAGEFLGEALGVKAGPLAQRRELADSLEQSDSQLEQAIRERDEAREELRKFRSGD
jgi:hypothetical protein